MGMVHERAASTVVLTVALLAALATPTRALEAMEPVGAAWAWEVQGTRVETRLGPDGDAVHHVHMVNTAFSPKDLGISTGDTVDWHNHDFVTHTATEDGNAWNTGDITQGQTKSITFNSAANYSYHCVYHSFIGMTGTLDVAGGNQAPTVTVTSPAEGATVQGTVTIQGTASDPDGTVSRVEVRIDGGTFQNATGTTNWTFTWNTANFTDASHLLEARSFDGTDFSPIAQRNATVQNRPTVAITSPASGSAVEGTVAIQGTASDTTTNGTISKVEVRIDTGTFELASGTTSWSFSWDTTTVGNGNHTVDARSTDNANLTSSLASITLDVQNLGPGNARPTVSIASPAEGADVEGSVTVNGTAADTDGNVSKVEVRIEGGTWQLATGTTDWTFAWDTTAYADGSRLVEARSFDGTAFSTIAQRNATVANPPTVAFTSPAEGAEVKGTATLQGTASDPGPEGNVSKVEVRIDGGDWRNATGTTSWSFAWDTTAHADGNHTVEARATDMGGLVSSLASRTLKVANPPTASFTSPAAGATVRDTVTVNGTAGDPGPGGNVSKVEVRIDAGDWRNATGTVNWSFAWDTTAHADGNRTLEARATDAGGLVGSPASRVLKVANPPTVTLDAPANHSKVRGNVTIKGTARDPGPSPSLQVEVRINNTWREANGTTDWSYAWDSREVDDGLWRIEARAFDGALYSTVPWVEVEVDNKRPDLTVKNLGVAPALTFQNITADIPNIGDDTAGPFEVAFYYAGGDGALKKIGTKDVGGLAPGQVAKVFMVWNVLGKLGNFTIVVRVDEPNVVDEHREDNNEATGFACVPPLLGLTCLVPGRELL